MILSLQCSPALVSEGPALPPRWQRDRSKSWSWASAFVGLDLELSVWGFGFRVQGFEFTV